MKVDLQVMTAEASISFVVLHYNAFQETINCVDSILNNVRASNLNVVVVDNCSPNGSGVTIKEHYKSESRVYYIGLDKNAGFAVGNNSGINYAKEVLGSDFVCCINNDTIVDQSSFFENILRIYNETNAAVIGPKVFLRDKSYQRFFTKLETVQYYKKQLFSFRKRLVIIKVKHALETLGVVRSNKLTNKQTATKTQDVHFFETEHEDVILHGCCLC